MSGHESDALGVAGEAAFRNLCSRAKLIPNKTELDRCGWDFRVEWRNTSNVGFSDTSPPRRAAFVQVKSVFQDTSHFSVRLGAANDLVKTLEPSFFIVPVFTRDLKLIEIRGAQTFGPIASEILKAIRQSVTDGSDASDHCKKFSLAKWTTPIAPEPSALENYFAEHMGADLREYSLAKQDFLRKTGFAEAHLSLNARFFGTPEEFADALLGDRPISGELVSAFEERFEIALPVENFQPVSGSFEFSPEPHARVRATFRDSSAHKQFRFDGDEFRLPAIIADQFSKVKFDFLYFYLYMERSRNDKNAITFQTKTKELRSIRDTVGGWTRFYNFLSAASSRRLALRLTRAGSHTGALIGHVGPAPTIASALQIERAIAVLNLLHKVLHDCGIDGVEFSPDDMCDLEHTLDCLSQSFGRMEPPYLHLAVDAVDAPLMASRMTMLLTFRFLEQFLTIIIRAERLDNKVEGGREVFTLRDVEYVRSELTDSFDEVDAIASDLASECDDEDVLMLPQGDIANGQQSPA